MGIERSESAPVKGVTVRGQEEGSAREVRRASSAGVGKGWMVVTDWYADWLLMVARKA